MANFDLRSFNLNGSTQVRLLDFRDTRSKRNLHTRALQRL